MKLIHIILALFLTTSLSSYTSLAQGDDTVYSLADKQPVYPGGMAAFFRYIETNLQYPVAAQAKGVEGRVFVEYIVEKNGKISGAKILKGLNNECDQEAIRLISNTATWAPGEIDGKKVRVKMALPLHFKLPK
ncbi:energy transducer TonB [Reichenbachiella carrageenanivorans]|uniref:Energy transducer TonB n=1 Tax=Reichenbachiella carrageenanivorans TaxID=2979869 RepID=A0ABY6D3C6_9BACT|nr:energy transducer TonB [Reichenbachiella carrageenanivorans]UXX80130.1 energy transducer TonB [Reichenbachiella carrageenanivorans]